MVLIALLGLLLIAGSILYWKRRPQDPAPMYLGLFFLGGLMLQPDQSGYDRSLGGMMVSAQVMLYVYLSRRSKTRS